MKKTHAELVAEAAARTLAETEKFLGSKVHELELIEGFNREHLRDMVLQMRDGDFNPDKADRWLGWLQAACVGLTDGRVSITSCKQINRELLT